MHRCVSSLSLRCQHVFGPKAFSVYNRHVFRGKKRKICQPHAINAGEEEPHVSRWKAEGSGGEWKVWQGFSDVADEAWTRRKLQLLGSRVEPLQSRSQL